MNYYGAAVPHGSVIEGAVAAGRILRVARRAVAVVARRARAGVGPAVGAVRHTCRGIPVVPVPG